MRGYEVARASSVSARVCDKLKKARYTLRETTFFDEDNLEPDENVLTIFFRNKQARDDTVLECAQISDCREALEASTTWHGTSQRKHNSDKSGLTAYERGGAYLSFISCRFAQTLEEQRDH